MKVERVSYEVMTPSAARGALQAVFWKPEFDWHIQKITVCKPIRWMSFRRNEVKGVLVPSGSEHESFIEDDRTQRNTVALRDVDYVVEAFFELKSPEISGSNSVAKYVDQFLRRMRRGQFFHAPCFGCREFAAQLSLAEEDAVPHGELKDVNRPLGWMFFDFDWETYTQENPKLAKDPDAKIKNPPQPLFFEARLDNGVLHVPPIHEVKARMAQMKSMRAGEVRP
jgi:CRISPR-associated protein Cas5d